MLIDAYTKVMASQRLQPLVKYHAFGDQTELDKVATAPRVIWIPSTGLQAPPDMLGTYKGVIDGRQAIATSIAMVKRGGAYNRTGAVGWAATARYRRGPCCARHVCRGLSP